jgi:hypothetical protein
LQTLPLKSASSLRDAHLRDAQEVRGAETDLTHRTAPTIYAEASDTPRRAENRLSDLFPSSIDGPPRRDDASPLHGFALAILVSAVIYAVIAEILYLTVW